MSAAVIWSIIPADQRKCHPAAAAACLAVLHPHSLHTGIQLDLKVNYGLSDHRGWRDGPVDCCLSSIGYDYWKKYWADTNTTQYRQVLANTQYPNTGIVWTLAFNQKPNPNPRFSLMSPAGTDRLHYFENRNNTRGGCLNLYYCNMLEWFWWDSSLISTTNWFPSVLWHCWFGHPACKNRPRNDLLCVEWDVKLISLADRHTVKCH